MWREGRWGMRGRGVDEGRVEEKRPRKGRGVEKGGGK